MPKRPIRSVAQQVTPVQPLPAADQILDLKGACRFLALSSAQVVRLVDHARLPAADLSVPRNGKRPKRLLRFDPLRLREWLREREKAAQP